MDESEKILLHNFEVQVCLIDYARLVGSASGRPEDVGADVEVISPAHNRCLAR